ncbi:MAG: hypothetical protein HW380_50 [Magnetococcales bacterium]|nr:hypothetical protein [Magnetococcales bacterium]HIJ82710.1 hypothetical protein [Magnetococcales bacterium]
MRKKTTIPLMRPDLTRLDLDAVAGQLSLSPFRNDELVSQWQLAWSELWNRRAILFDDPVDAILALKDVLGWRDGARIAAGSGMHPAWREGFAAAWIRVVFHDVEPTYPLSISRDGGFSGVFVDHFQGIPVSAPDGPGTVLEDLSSMPAPLPGTGYGAVQLMVLDGNAMIQGGNAALILCRDASMAAQLQARRHPPSALMAALGMSQFRQMEPLLARRSSLASRYLAIRTGGMFGMPSVTPRWWHGFYLWFDEESQRDGLCHFLRKGGILAESTGYFSSPEVEHMTWQRRFARHGLALPLYASLNDQEQKRIINRIHRWVHRGGPSVSV